MQNKTNRFGNYLDRALAMRKVPRTALGSLIGVERNTVKKWCAGEEFPNSAQIKRIEAVLDLRPGQIEAEIKSDKERAKQTSACKKSELINLVRRLPEERAKLWLEIIRQVEHGGSKEGGCGGGGLNGIH